MRENNLIPPEVPPVIEALPPKSKFKIPPIVLGLLLGIIFTGGAFAAYNYIYLPSKTPLDAIPTPSTPSEFPSPSTAPTGVDSGEFGQLTWMTPIKTINPSILNTTSEYSYSFDTDLGSYIVGKFSNGAELMVSFIRPEGPSNAVIVRIIKDNGQYSLIESLITDKYIKNDLEKIFDKSKIKFISFNTLGLLPLDYITVDKNTYSAVPAAFTTQFFPLLKDPVKLGTSPSGDVYATYRDAYESKNVLGREIFLKLPDSTLQNYRPTVGFISDDRVPAVTYTGGELNKTAFEQGIPFQCGIGSANTVIKNGNPILNDKQEVGYLTTNTNKKIYQVKKTDSELVKVLYKSYKTGRDYPNGPPILSIDQFNETRNHFLYQDVTGDWIVYVSSQYAPAVECGKPVIYLYPQKDTEVTVKVAADVTKSEPVYPQNGWTVLAHPSGQLEYQGKIYPNLFWEGLGHGNYPNIGNAGFVVAQNNLISTIYSHLSKLGLNSQESADFMEFWADKLPKTPYVRLSWITTAGMNQLAPLSVSPQPDTVIRIFLDFEGLQKPINLVPQKLTSIPRRGFTLIEWGGLLQGKY